MRTIIMKPKNKEKEDIRLSCTDNIAEMLLSSDTDPSIKQLVVNGLLSQASGNTKTTSSRDDDVQPSCSSDNLTSISSGFDDTQPSCNINNTSSPPDVNLPSSSTFHMWTDKQEDMLVHMRHEMNDDFCKTRNHTTLWNEIATEINSTLKCKISATQVTNKYFSLKKRWKEVIDSAGAKASGTERKYFRLKEDFDQMYGTKASSRPSYILDTNENEEQIQVEEKVKAIQPKERVYARLQRDSQKKEKTSKVRGKEKNENQ